MAKSIASGCPASESTLGSRPRCTQAIAESLRPVFREQLFAAYWTRGEDLTPEVLERFGGSGRDEPTTARWRAEWLALPRPIVPMMILPNGWVSRGLGSLAHLAEMVAATRVRRTDREGGDPACWAHLFENADDAEVSAAPSKRRSAP